MKKRIAEIAKLLLPVSAAVFVIHVVLRVLLIFRADAYGAPFVGKPDWYIFHAIAIDYLWIVNVFLVAAVVAFFLPRFAKVSLIVFHSVILLLTYIDHEVQRFLGTHLTFSLFKTYKDPSSLEMFFDYIAYDKSVPYLQYFVLVAAPFAFYFLTKYFNKLGLKIKFRNCAIGLAIFYVVCYLFLNVIWGGGSRLKKLMPVVLSVKHSFESASKVKTSVTPDMIDEYQRLWLSVDSTGEWKFTQKDFPLWREPVNPSYFDLQSAPNIIVVFLESHRYINVKKASPFLDSLMNVSLGFNRMNVSGLPTTGGILSSHTGILSHSSLSLISELSFAQAPSFASYLRDAGYRADYFSAADPSWDNLNVWVDKWYSRRHYDRFREDDSTFWAYSSEFVKDSLAGLGKPFLATFMTRSNHYPFNFAPGMSGEEKDKDIVERYFYTTNYADRQLANFVHSIEKEEWFKNTCLIVTADHGFPTGENGNSTMSGEAYYSSTWIPLVISCPFLESKIDSTASSQIDLAPTILELAGLRVANPFMGHSLLQARKDFGLSVHFGSKTISYDDEHLVYSDNLDALYLKSDSLQENNLAAQNENIVNELKGIAENTVKVSDFVWENNRVDFSILPK